MAPTSMAASGLRVSAAQMQHAREILEAFVSIRSVSNKLSPDYDMDHLRKAANFVQDQLNLLDFDTKQVSVDGCAPYVMGERMVAGAKKTILVYGHYDLQPTGDLAKWKTDPYALTEKDGGLHGRGATDDKGGIVAVLTALGALIAAEGDLPVNIKFLAEGEEEDNSSHMEEFLSQHTSELDADALVVMDGGNRNTETGTLTSSTRGLQTFSVKVLALGKPEHSGVGVLIPDPMQDMAALIASCKQPRMIPGFMDDCEVMGDAERQVLREGSQTPEEYSKGMGVREGGVLRGDSKLSISERVLEEPSFSVVNCVSGQIGGGNSIQDQAEATFGFRLTPGQDPKRITEVVLKHLKSVAIGSGQLEVKPLGEGCWAWKADLGQPVSQAYLEALRECFPQSCAEPCGGALPLLKQFQRFFPHMEMIVPGVEDPKCGAHSFNESQDLALWERAMNGFMTFLQKVRNM